MLDAKAFGQELAVMVKAQLSPLADRIGAMERRLGALSDAVAALPVPEPGLAEEQVLKLVGGVEDRAADRARDAARAAVAEIAVVSPDDLAAVRRAVEEIRVPEIPELPDIPALIRGEVERAVGMLPPAASGQDGVGIAGALIDRSGDLVVTLSNGEVKALGPVVGRDADPAPPGRDGLGFEDMDFEIRDGRAYAVFRRGDVVKEVRLPGISYRGVWKDGGYLAGDSATFGGCQWIALEDTDEKPGEGKAWQMAVRKGRDGRDQAPTRIDAPKGV